MTLLPDFSAATFGDPTTITNMFFPLPGGTINSYGATLVDPETGEEETERNDHFATFDTKVIEGVETVVVRDTAYADGVLVEDTLDWYAQDDGGNVWYLGEIATNYNYDDEGNFIGTDFDGSWQAGVDGAAPGWIMRAAPTAGDDYFQEFYAGVAEDEGEVIATGLHVDTDFGAFDDVVKILDTSALDPGVGAFKYFAPGIGLVLEEEVVISEDEPELVSEITNRREVDVSAAVDPTDLAFAGNGTEKTITFVSEDASSNGAIGAYTFDAATGVIGEARILFADTEDAKAGAKAQMTVASGQSLGLFLIPDAETLGLELEDYEDGGLFFRNFTSGNVAHLYDGDDATTYTPGVATIYDRIAPVVTDEEGNLLPIRAFHSAGNRDGFNFLNPVAGENALAADLGTDDDEVAVVSFEDGLASTGDFDGDFDDAFVAVSDAPLSRRALKELVEETDISRLVGTDGKDWLFGTRDDDQLIGLDGKDVIKGRHGDDQIEAGDGNDRAYGGNGDDEIFGEEGNDRLCGGKGDDTIDGGEGHDRIFGGKGKDEIDGGEGGDRLYGGEGFDDINGGDGNDWLWAGPGGARMSGGADDDTLIGQARAEDTFVFDLIPFGDDLIRRFENGRDHIEIAIYTGVESFDDIDVTQEGSSTVLTFAEGTVEIAKFNATSIDASDFFFV
ncbi:calcium-binding protein [Rhizobium giardinii]|uniref:calcium-binding protein n=1 Tax=Rhizobium giardinii TaxID=56731 RepID=UPI003D6EB6EF